ncbi:MerR family transcriptional regulator [Nocardioides nematodiphilus]|uniref:MerR family transcriptional regulator n=1 Tax=Nocardioides nematodiphilus TaxID=2849669 RepID=UPI001CD9391F|nr:MerR family transcriptional regulator [Nocardioides nematodiphilus]MCA1983569.1 MerR family transcriptional regulator [Nocardioides nematodiphilus]
MAMTIAEAAAASGLSADTLRYYERDGLMAHPVGRSASGHRRYTDTDLSWIEMVTRLRATGMPIRDVRRYAAMIRTGGGNELERLELLRAHRERVLDELAAVQAHLAAIDVKIDLYLDQVGHRIEPACLDGTTRDNALDLERTPSR